MSRQTSFACVIAGLLCGLVMTACTSSKSKTTGGDPVGDIAGAVGARAGAEAPEITEGLGHLTGLVSGMRQSADDMSEAEEHYLGRTVTARLLAKHPLVDDLELNRYVNRVGRTLAGHSKRPEIYDGYRFGVIESAEPNAYAAPGGFVLVTRAALELAETEDELAGILAHEIAHIAAGHPRQAVNPENTQALFAVAQFGMAQFAPDDMIILKDILAASASDVVRFLLESGYDQAQESEADGEAIEILYSSGYDPSALAAIIERLPATEGWLKSGPTPTSRAQGIRSRTRNFQSETDPVRTARFAQATR